MLVPEEDNDTKSVTRKRSGNYNAAEKLGHRPTTPYSAAE